MNSTTRERILGMAGVLMLLLVAWLVVTRLGGPAPDQPAPSVLGDLVDQPAIPVPTLPPAPTAAPTAPPRANPTTHLIVSGQTLAEIAALYQVDVATIAAVNQISDANSIRAGQLLRIPAIGETATLPTGELAGCQYRVDAGESLWGIATDYSVSVESLREANDLAPDQPLLIGQVINIPPESPAC